MGPPSWSLICVIPLSHQKDQLFGTETDPISPKLKEPFTPLKGVQRKGSLCQDTVHSPCSASTSLRSWGSVSGLVTDTSNTLWGNRSSSEMQWDFRFLDFQTRNTDHFLHQLPTKHPIKWQSKLLIQLEWDHFRVLQHVNLRKPILVTLSFHEQKMMTHTAQLSYLL